MSGSRARSKASNDLSRRRAEWLGSSTSSVHAAKNAVRWVVKIATAINAKDCDETLDSLISLGSQHLIAMRADASMPSLKPIETLEALLRKWRVATAEATALGLDGGISSSAYQRDIQLPKELVVARKWFETVERVIDAGDPGPERLAKLMQAAQYHLDAVEACRSSWPQARRMSIERRASYWRFLLAQWAHSEASAVFATVRAAQLDAIAQQNANPTVANYEVAAQAAQACEGAREVLAEAILALGTGRKLLRTEEQLRLQVQKKQREKRTCSMCGKTVPNYFRSFFYCGGCRQPSVAREYWTRYCSVECQRAHWAAGHKDKCPCAREG